MVNNSTNINKTNNYLSPQLNGHKKDLDIYDFGNPDHGLVQAQKCGRVKLVNGISTPPLDNWITNSTFIYCPKCLRVQQIKVHVYNKQQMNPRLL